MKKPKFLESIHIGAIIRTEMNKQRLTKEMLADKTLLKKWIVRDTFKQQSIKINRLIKFSYALEVDFLQVYLQKMPFFGNSKSFEDKVRIKIDDGQISMTLSKKSRTADFTENIHIGKLLKAEAKKQSMQDALPEILFCSQNAVNRMFDNPDIDTGRLIWMSDILDYDFLRNIYLPYMAVNKEEMIANDCISDTCNVEIEPKAISIITENQMGIYEGIWSPKSKHDMSE